MDTPESAGLERALYAERAAGSVDGIRPETPVHADQVGLDRILRRVREFGRNLHGGPAFWTPAPLLERLGETGGSLSEHRFQQLQARHQTWTRPAQAPDTVGDIDLTVPHAG